MADFWVSPLRSCQGLTDSQEERLLHKCKSGRTPLMRMCLGFLPRPVGLVTPRGHVAATQSSLCKPSGRCETSQTVVWDREPSWSLLGPKLAPRTHPQTCPSLIFPSHPSSPSAPTLLSAAHSVPQTLAAAHRSSARSLSVSLA